MQEHSSPLENNLSAIAEHHQKTGHNPDVKHQSPMRRRQINTSQSERGNFHQERDQPTLNRDRGRGA